MSQSISRSTSKKSLLLGVYLFSLTVGFSSCATESMFYYCSANAVEDEKRRSQWYLAPAVLLPFTLAWDVITFPIQYAFDYPPYGPKEHPGKEKLERAIIKKNLRDELQRELQRPLHSGSRPRKKNSK